MESRSGAKMRVAVLWTRLSGYLNACLYRLAIQEGAELFVSYWRATNDAPYAGSQFAWMKNAVPWTETPDEPNLIQRVEDFHPDILIFGGWHIRAYRNIAKRWNGRCLRVMTMDNCWNGTFKQFAAAIAGPGFIRPLAERVWLPGERQAVFARKLGFPEHSILRGLYTCDQAPLAASYQARIDSGRTVARAFIYVGRLVPQKGIKTLATAYQRYREQASQPWPLYCYGDGPERHLLEALDGVHMEGFCQPENLPPAFAKAACLILPSNFEPWAVAIHEATTAGLIVLASNAVGAAVHLVQPGYNGYIFASGNPQELELLMHKISAMPPQELDQMSRASSALSHQFSPALWTTTLMDTYTSWTGIPREVHENAAQEIV